MVVDGVTPAARFRAFAGVAALLLFAGALDLHGPQDFHLTPHSAIAQVGLSGEAPSWRADHGFQERSPCHACLHRLQSQGFAGRPVALTVALAEQGKRVLCDGPALRQRALTGRSSRGPPLPIAPLV